MILLPVLMERIPRCPGCGASLRAHIQTTKVEPHVPRPGDFAVCGHCSTVLRYENDRLEARVALAEEVEAELAVGHLDDDSADLLRRAIAYRQLRRGGGA